MDVEWIYSVFACPSHSLESILTRRPPMTGTIWVPQVAGPRRSPQARLRDLCRLRSPNVRLPLIRWLIAKNHQGLPGPLGVVSLSENSSACAFQRLNKNKQTNNWISEKKPEQIHCECLGAAVSPTSLAKQTWPNTPCPTNLVQQTRYNMLLLQPPLLVT